MFTNNELYMTEKDLAALNKRLDELRTRLNVDIAQRLRAAIALGDITENAEYEDARNEQSFVKGQILELEDKLSKAVIFSGEDVTEDVVGMGTRVVVRNEQYGDEDVYHICGTVSADPLRGFISNDSPVGSALYGKRVGDSVAVNTPGGSIRLTILSITKSDEVQ